MTRLRAERVRLPCLLCAFAPLRELILPRRNGMPEPLLTSPTLRAISLTSISDLYRSPGVGTPGASYRGVRGLVMTIREIRRLGFQAVLGGGTLAGLLL